MDPKHPLWDKNDNVQQPLRQPAALQQHQIKEEKKSELNVNAKEFVPSYMSSVAATSVTISAPRPSSGYSAQNRLTKYKQNGSTSSHNTLENGTMSSSNLEHLGEDMKKLQVDDIDSFDEARVKHIIKSLVNYPGCLEKLLDVFMDTVCPYFGDILALSHIADLLVSEAITYPSFRYTGARLCWYVEQSCPEFRAEIHLKCKKALDQNPDKQGTVLFISELYTQLPHQSLYGPLLVRAMMDLIEAGGNANIKCVCQSLKLTGYSLDEHNKQALNEVFNKLKEVKDVNGSAKILLDSVFSLRQVNWGRSNTEPNSSSSESECFEFEEPQNGVIYNSDGTEMTELTSEEREFLNMHTGNYFDAENECDDPDDLFDPEPEMDEEIQKAFREFTKLSKR